MNAPPIKDDQCEKAADPACQKKKRAGKSPLAGDDCP